MPGILTLFLALMTGFAWFHIELTAKILGVALVSEVLALLIMSVGIIVSGGGPDGFSAAPLNPANIFNNDAALNSIVVEWSSSHSFSTRIANLGGLLNSGTVNDDGVRDTLSGDGGRDWFLDFPLADTISDFSLNPTKGDKKN